MSPRLALLLGTAACVAACGAAAPKGSAPPLPAKAEPLQDSRLVPLGNAGFESAPRAGERCPQHWGCTVHNNPDAFAFRLETVDSAEGRQHLCVERVQDEPWALASIGMHDASLRGAKARFSVAVRIDRPEGGGAGAWILVHGPLGPLAHEERVVQATQGWERLSIDFTVPTTAQIVEVGAIKHGPGRVCIDDARLEILTR